MKRITLVTLAIVFSFASIARASAGPPRLLFKAQVLRGRTEVRHLMIRPRRYAGTGCTTSDPTTSEIFIGIPSQSNVAASLGDAVAGGGSNEACGNYSGILSGYGNKVSPGALGAAVVAGFSNSAQGYEAFIGGGDNNSATGSISAVGAGTSNTASGDRSVVVGGALNAAAGNGSVVGGGGYEFSSACNCTVAGNLTAGIDSFIGGGDLNFANGNGSVVAGGGYTFAKSCSCSYVGNEASGDDSFVGAGDQNVAAGADAFLGSGASNNISATATYGSLIGAGGIRFPGFTQP